MIQLELPWPPSANHYWRHVGKMVKISKEGREYRKKVISAVKIQGHQKLTGAIGIKLLLYTPDWRRRDQDNLNKPLLDALGAAGVYEDDSFIVRQLTDKHNDPEKQGRVIVQLYQFDSGVIVKKSGAWLK